MKEFLEGYSITTGAVRYNDLGYLLATDDSLIEQGVAHTRVITIDQGDWGGYDLDWLACSATVCHIPEEKLIVTEQLGSKSWVVGGGHISDEIFDPSIQPPVSRRGYIRETREIAGGKLYAAGTCRQLYRRDGPGQWTRLDIWHNDQSEKILDCSFESVDGFSEGEIYTVGWEGEIWLFDGENWTQIDTPTNAALFKVLCAPNGQVYAAGSAGLLVTGRGLAWQVIEQDDTEEDIWGLAWFNDTLYLSTTSMLYRLQEDRLVPVDFGDCEIPSSCYHLSAADGIMWSIGAQDVMQFNGSEWIRIY